MIDKPVKWLDATIRNLEKELLKNVGGLWFEWTLVRFFSDAN